MEQKLRLLLNYKNINQVENTIDFLRGAVLGFLPIFILEKHATCSLSIQYPKQSKFEVKVWQFYNPIH